MTTFSVDETKKPTSSIPLTPGTYHATALALTPEARAAGQDRLNHG